MPIHIKPKPEPREVLSVSYSASKYGDRVIDDLMEHVRYSKMESDAEHNAKQIMQALYEENNLLIKRAFNHGVLIGISLSLLLALMYVSFK